MYHQFAANAFNMPQPTRTALRAKISQNNNRFLSPFDGATLNGLDKVVFIVKRAGLPYKSKPLLTSNLGHSTTRRKIAFQNSVVDEDQVMQDAAKTYT